MLSAASMSHRSPPGEEDLLHLYNEVWAGFSDDPPSTTIQRPSTASTGLESLYGAYGADDDVSPTTNLGGRIPSVGSSMNCEYFFSVCRSSVECKFLMLWVWS